MALSMKYIETWLMWRDGVKIGDFNVLMEGCNWISFWSAIGKPRYLLKTKRRIEQEFALDLWQREYYLGTISFTWRKLNGKIDLILWVIGDGSRIE